MTDIERIELAIRRVLANAKSPVPYAENLLSALADELGRMRQDDADRAQKSRDYADRVGYKLNWVP